MTDTADDSEPVSPDSAQDLLPTYSYRPTLMGTGWTFQLAPDGIVWHVGSHSGRVLYSRVRRVRLSFRPTTMQ